MAPQWRSRRIALIDVLEQAQMHTPGNCEEDHKDRPNPENLERYVRKQHLLENDVVPHLRSSKVLPVLRSNASVYGSQIEHKWR